MKRLEEIPEKPYNLRVELNRIIRAINQLALESGKLALEVDKTDNIVQMTKRG